MTAEEKISKARVQLILDHPFFGSLILRLEPVDATGMFVPVGMQGGNMILSNIPTMATDGKKLYYNPKFVDGMSQDETKGVLVHEIFHPMFQHHTRLGSREPRKANVAMDLAINPIIEEAGFKLPKDRLREKKYDGKTWEDIYDMLPDLPKQKGGNGNGDGDPDPGKCGAVLPATGKDGKQQASPSENSQQEQEWRIAVAQAAQQAKRQGKLPAGMERWIDEIVNPTIDWREVLRRFVSETAKNDYRWFPPNKRYIYKGLYLPSVRSEALPPIVIGIDTSGSIDKEMLNQFAGEITGILEDYATTCHVIYCDAGVANVQEFTQDDLPLKLDPKGGGGTDFRPVFDWIRETNTDLCCLIYLTDLCGTFPEVPPEYPVLWAVMGGYDIKAPFGETIPIKPLR